MHIVMKHFRQRTWRIVVGTDEEGSYMKMSSHSTEISYASRQGSGANSCNVHETQE